MMSTDMCTVSLFTLNLTMDQTLYNYSCVSIMNDHQDLPRKIERLVSLQIEDTTTAPVSPHEVPIASNLKVKVYRNGGNHSLQKSWWGSVRVAVGENLQLACLSSDEHCEGQWMRDNVALPNTNSGALLQWTEISQEDGGSYTCHCASQNITVIIEVIKDDYSGWIQILTAIALSAAVMLMLKLMFLWYKKQRSLQESEVSSLVIYENTRPKKEGVTPRPLEQDCQSDPEVPYADIVISVRGSSVPELTGVRNHNPRDHRPRWRGEDSAAGARLHACRSADRLHVNQKEIGRRLSTTSEYAVITYSADALS
ncbi:uncharacterized protein LOC143478048 [Brachyhypopomus gauderio]|uniref:uncharacterized protein LOC143478048 n=1 Tax=Brachyhypopomus gauderio TaxID=698409 RepID=UPI0040415047